MLREEEGAGRVSLVLVTDGTIRSLNARHLGRKGPTDVMAFPFGDSRFLGEVYVSTDRARAQSRMYAVSYENELSRLMVHGLLHLLGYNDRSTREAAAMHRREDRYLKPEWEICRKGIGRKT